MMETRLIPKKFLKLIKNLADENRNYKKIFGNVFWLEVVKEKNYTWFNLRLNSILIPTSSADSLLKYCLIALFQDCELTLDRLTPPYIAVLGLPVSSLFTFDGGRD